LLFILQERGGRKMGARLALIRFSKEYHIGHVAGGTWLSGMGVISLCKAKREYYTKRPAFKKGLVWASKDSTKAVKPL